MTRNRATNAAPRIGFVSILFFLVVMPVAAMLRGLCGSTESDDLKPRPDALEYAVAAQELVEHGSYSLDLGGVNLPPRYPPGTSLLFTPFVALGGAQCAWCAALLYGVLAVFFGAWLGYLVGGAPGCIATGVLLTSSPAAVLSSTLAMSESASTWLSAIALLCAAASNWRARSSRISERTRLVVLLAGALACGFATTIRYTNLAFVVPLAIAAWEHEVDGRRHLSRVLVSILPSAIGLMLVGLRNAVDFGNPFHDGYRYWVPELYTHSELVFSLAYLVKPLAGLFPEGNLAAYGQALAGGQSQLYAWPAAVLAALGIGRNFVLRRSCPVARAMNFATFTTAPAILAFYLLYAWQDTRFLEPLLPLLAACAASGALIARDLLAGQPRLGSLVATLVALCAILPGVIPRLDRLLVNDPSKYTTLDGLLRLGKEIEADAVVISDQPAALLYSALPDSVESVSVDLDLCDPHLSRVVRFGLSDREGRKPQCRTLGRGETIDHATFAWLDERLRAGRVIYLCPRQAGRAETAGERELLRRYAHSPLNWWPDPAWTLSGPIERLSLPR